MSSNSYSSFGTGAKRRGVLHDDIDRSVYTVGQTLASIVNDPRTAHQTGGGFWGLGHDASQAPQPPALDPAKYPPVSKADLQQYINLVHGAYDRFIRDRQSLEAFDAKHQPGSSDPRAGCGQGEPFMAAVQVVPSAFFQEGFFDNWDEFFRQYCKEQSAEELYEQIDQLNKNLDVVELQLLREVASRSESFFQAAASLQQLLGLLGGSVASIRGLRRSLAQSDEQMYSTAVAVKGLQARRSNLQATLDITKGLEQVAAAQAALDCMLEGQDYAGALALLAELKALLEAPGLMGLQCVRHLPPRLAETTAAVERALAAEFLATLANGELARVVAEAAADAEAQPDASVSTDGRAAGGSAWQLPPGNARDAAAAREALHEKLLPLAVGLYRAERLPAALQQYKAAVGEEVKAGVRDAVQQVLPVLLAACGEQQHAGQAGSETQLADQLQLLHHGAFMVLLHAAARVIFSCVDHALAVGQLLEATLAGINTPASQLASLRKECGAALQAVADAGLGRWVKLLAARSAANTRLRQYELRQLLDLSEQVASHSEALGARTSGAFRTALQAQCKGLLDASHSRALNQLQHLLESEQWVAVEVPAGFQAIVDRLLARCGEGAALLDGRPHMPDVQASTAAAAAAAAEGQGSEGGGEARSATLALCGKSFHLVNSALMLLKMLDEYMSLYELMPQFGAEIVHRQLEALKLFNSQTAALVLGAGAMRTAGLRSISAKQLALSCQAVAMLATLLPPLRAGSLGLVSQPRRALLMPEFDRLLQDLTMHMDEVHSKLVDIMRDRLAAAVQTLPGEVHQLAANPALSANPEQPSHTIALLVKQLGTLRSVLAPYLLKEEVEFIFGAVARAYSDALSECFEALMAQDAACEAVVKANALAMLQAFRDLPLDPTRSSNYCSRLSTTYTKHFGLPPWDQQRLGVQGQQQQGQQDQQLQEQDSLQLQHVAPQQLQEQESDQLTAHQQEPEQQQQQQQDQQLNLQPWEEQQQQQRQDSADHAAQVLEQQASEQGGTDQQRLSEPDDAPAVAATPAVAPLGAVEQWGQEQQLEHDGQHVSEQQQELEQQEEEEQQQQQGQLQREAGGQPPAWQEEEQQQQQQQHQQHVVEEQQQLAPALQEQELPAQQQQQMDEAAAVDRQQLQELLLHSTAAGHAAEQLASEEPTLLLDASQDDALQQQVEQQPLQQQEQQLHDADQQEAQLGLSGQPRDAAAAAAAVVVAEHAQLGAGNALGHGSTDSAPPDHESDGAVSGRPVATHEEQQPAASLQHFLTLEEQQQQQQDHLHEVLPAAADGLDGNIQQHGQEGEPLQQQQQQPLPAGASAGAADGKQLESDQKLLSSAVDFAANDAQHAVEAAAAADPAAGGSDKLSLSSLDAVAAAAAPAVGVVTQPDESPAAASGAEVLGVPAALLDGLEQPQAEAAAEVTAADAEAAAAGAAAGHAHEPAYYVPEQPQSLEAVAAPGADADASVGASPALLEAPADDLLGGWGDSDALQGPGDAPIAAAANGDVFSTGTATAPQEQQQQQQPGGSGAAASGRGLLDLLWDDSAEQQQQGVLSSSNGSWQHSSAVGNGLAPQAVDSSEELSLLDDPPAGAAATAASDDAAGAAVQQHNYSGTGHAAVHQPAELPEAAAQQPAESSAAGPSGADGSKHRSSMGEAGAQSSMPSNGSWDPLNASSAPPAAAAVEGALL